MCDNERQLFYVNFKEELSFCSSSPKYKHGVIKVKELHQTGAVFAKQLGQIHGKHDGTLECYLLQYLEFPGSNPARERNLFRVIINNFEKKTSLMSIVYSLYICMKLAIMKF